MKRPLLTAGIFLVVILWIKLAVGDTDALTAALSGADSPYTGETVTVIGQICQINLQDKQFQIKSVQLTREGEADSSAQTQSQTISFSKQYKMIVKTSEDVGLLKIGQTVALTGAFMPFSHATNPGEFDSADYYSSLGIIASIKSAEILALGEAYSGMGQAAYRCRLLLRQRIERLFPEKQAGIMCALLLGDKSELDRETKELYKRNGILHILSISSLHISILGMSLYRGLRKCRLPVPVAAFCGTLLLVFYGWMTGFPLSAVRAIGMFFLRMLALVWGRTYDLLTSLGLLGALMVLYRPYYLLNAGFLLSFSAVYGVGVIYPALAVGKTKAFTNEQEAGWIVMLRKWRDGLADSAIISLSITLATLPVQLWYYSEVPLLSTLINLIILPFVRPLVLAGMLCLVPGLGLLNYLDRGILLSYERICATMDGWSLRTWNPGHPAMWQVVLYYLLLGLGLYFIGYLRTEGRKNCPELLRKAGQVVAVGLPVCLFFFGGLRGNKVLFLDVGQGNCILIHNASGENYLYDCGSSSKTQVGEYVLLPCLKYYGIHKIDAILISHPDSDHMNGILELLADAETQRVEIGQLLLPAIATERREEEFATIWGRLSGEDLPVRFLAAGDHWSLGSVKYTCLHPEAESDIENSNDYSLCLSVEFRTYRLLLMGDTGQEYERMPAENFLYAGTGKPVVLQVAHHGSKYSTSAEFLGQIQPAVALLSAGEDNSYGHPHLDTLERLEEAGADVFCTIDTGAILISERRKGIKLSLFDTK